MDERCIGLGQGLNQTCSNPILVGLTIGRFQASLFITELAIAIERDISLVTGLPLSGQEVAVAQVMNERRDLDTLTPRICPAAAAPCHMNRFRSPQAGDRKP